MLNTALSWQYRPIVATPITSHDIFKMRENLMFENACEKILMQKLGYTEISFHYLITYVSFLYL